MTDELNFESDGKLTVSFMFNYDFTPTDTVNAGRCVWEWIHTYLLTYILISCGLDLIDGKLPLAKRVLGVKESQ